MPPRVELGHVFERSDVVQSLDERTEMDESIPEFDLETIVRRKAFRSFELLGAKRDDFRKNVREITRSALRELKTETVGGRDEELARVLPARGYLETLFFENVQRSFFVLI